MAFLQREHVTTGELIAATFAELQANLRPAAIYLAAMVALALVARSGLAVVEDLAALAGTVAYFVGQYLLFEIALRNAGLAAAGGSRRVFRFAGMAFLVLFGVSLAANFFLIPGILVGARWIMAPSILVATPQGVFAALGESWSQTSGNTLPIALALSALMLMAFAAGVAASAASAALGAGEIAGSLLLHGGNLLLVCLSVAVYRRLNDHGAGLAEVFA